MKIGRGLDQNTSLPYHAFSIVPQYQYNLGSQQVNNHWLKAMHMMKSKLTRCFYQAGCQSWVLGTSNLPVLCLGLNWVSLLYLLSNKIESTSIVFTIQHPVSTLFRIQYPVFPGSRIQDPVCITFRIRNYACTMLRLPYLH